MADEAQANWRVVQAIFNEGPKNNMEDRERLSLFHWVQSLQQHTRKHIKKYLFDEHVSMCEEWRTCKKRDDALVESCKIWNWWRAGGVAKEGNEVIALDNWFCWWEVCIAHWGDLMSYISSLANFKKWKS